MKRLIIPALALCAAAFAPTAEAATVKWSGAVYRATLYMGSVENGDAIFNYEYLCYSGSGTAEITKAYAAIVYQYNGATFSLIEADTVKELTLGRYYLYQVFALDESGAYAKVADLCKTAREEDDHYCVLRYGLKSDGKPTAKPTGPGEIEPGGVPEPTSGLLLIVGAGLLALRRRNGIGGAE